MRARCTPLLTDAAPADITLWRVDIDLNAPLLEAGGSLLQADELERARRFLRHEDAARFVAMRATLRRLLAAELGCTAQTLALRAGANGRPMLDMHNAPDFNVSHSGAQGLIAISRKRRVGVDIEAARQSFDWRELQATVLHPTDQRAIDVMP